MVIKEIGLRLRAIFKTKWERVKLYLLLILSDKIMLYILSRFLLKKFFMHYTVSNVSPALIQAASLALIVWNPPKGKPYSAIKFWLFYGFFKLTCALIEQFIAAFWSNFSPKLTDFQNIQEVVEMCSGKSELKYF